MVYAQIYVRSWKYAVNLHIAQWYTPVPQPNLLPPPPPPPPQKKLTSQRTDWETRVGIQEGTPMYFHTSLAPIPILAEGKSNTISACSPNNLTHSDMHGYQYLPLRHRKYKVVLDLVLSAA